MNRIDPPCQKIEAIKPTDRSLLPKSNHAPDAKIDDIRSSTIEQRRKTFNSKNILQNINKSIKSAFARSLGVSIFSSIPPRRVFPLKEESPGKLVRFYKISMRTSDRRAFTHQYSI
jgi:hypothetical protein